MPVLARAPETVLSAEFGTLPPCALSSRPVNGTMKALGPKIILYYGIHQLIRKNYSESTFSVSMIVSGTDFAQLAVGRYPDLPLNEACGLFVTAEVRNSIQDIVLLYAL